MKADSYSEAYQMPLTRMLLGEHFHPGGLLLTEQLAIQTLVNTDSVVLDMACGLGNTGQYLANKFGADVYALDLGHRNLMDAQKCTLERDSSAKVHFIQGDAEHLPIANDSIDVVFCECAMSSFEHRELALREAYRVLKPRGFLALSDVFVNESLPREMNAEFNRWLSVNSAYNAIRSEEVVSQNGFYQIRFRDVSSQLLETVHTIESKLAVTTDSNRQLNEAVKPHRSEWKETLPTRLAQFIYDGGAGYYTLTARKPG